VRGDLAQTRARLQRVLRLRCPRPWGNVVGILTLERLAESERGRDEPARRADLELARDLATSGLESGDPRDAYLISKRAQLEQLLR
jgi:hypothetical protein